MSHPLLVQLDPRPVLLERAATLGRPATLDDLPDAELDTLGALSCDWVWLLGAWQTGEAGRRAALADPGIRAACHEALPDLTDEDVAGSPFAIARYTVHADLGGDLALARLRDRLAARSMRLMLDFIPNHTATDHAWVRDHPERYVQGTERDLERDPRSWFAVAGADGRRVIAHGRDPAFDAWTDTAQLDYRVPAVHEAMLAVLRDVAGRCDGVRCDMAMLVEPDVFARTWAAHPPAPGAAASSAQSAAFWPGAIAAVRREHPGFTLLAEVYWDLEWRLQQHGFDFTYDKGLYDRLRHGDSTSVRQHLAADPDFVGRCAHFLENHDEPRAAAVLSPAHLQAAAAIAFLSPGMALVGDGQLDGRRVRVPVQLRRRPAEPPDAALRAFYEGLLAVARRPVVRHGTWSLLGIHRAWPENPSSDAFVAFRWRAPGERDLLVVVNRSESPAQSYVELDPEGAWRLELADLLHPGTTYTRSGAELREEGGMYFDLGPNGLHVFEVTTRS